MASRCVSAISCLYNYLTIFNFLITNILYLHFYLADFGVWIFNFKQLYVL